MANRIACAALIAFLILSANTMAQMTASTSATQTTDTTTTLDAESFFNITNETDLSNMSTDELTDLYMSYIRLADTILDYLDVPMKDRPYPFNMTDSELYMLQSRSLRMAEDINYYMQPSGTNETSNEIPTTLIGPITESEENNTRPETNESNETLSMLSDDDIFYREKLAMTMKAESWMNYSSNTEFRKALGYIYEEPEIQKFVAAKYAQVNVSVIDSGRAVKIDTSGPKEVPVTTIDIAVSRQTTNIEIKIENVTKVPKIPENVTKVYSYLKIDKGRITDNEIEDVGLEFVVNKSWIESQGINDSDVKLFRLEDDWRELPTRKITEDYSKVYYEALSPGLSYFAIGITADVSSPLELIIPKHEQTPLETSDGLSSDNDLVKIRFNWVLVIIVIIILLMLRYTYITKHIKSLLKRESEDELNGILEDYKNQMNEAMNRYFKRQITEEQLNEIVNEIKKKQFSVEMRIKALKEKKAS